MLVLSRKIKESIRIGDSIEVVVLGTGGGRVRLGISAPYDTTIKRTELLAPAPVTAAANGVDALPAAASMMVSSVVHQYPKPSPRAAVSVRSDSNSVWFGSRVCVECQEWMPSSTIACWELSSSRVHPIS